MWWQFFFSVRALLLKKKNPYDWGSELDLSKNSYCLILSTLSAWYRKQNLGFRVVDGVSCGWTSRKGALFGFTSVFQTLNPCLGTSRDGWQGSVAGNKAEWGREVREEQPGLSSIRDLIMDQINQSTSSIPPSSLEWENDFGMFGGHPPWRLYMFFCLRTVDYMVSCRLWPR